jgi:hypothetical protein
LRSGVLMLGSLVTPGTALRVVSAPACTSARTTVCRVTFGGTERCGNLLSGSVRER